MKLSEFLNTVSPDGNIVVGAKGGKGFRHSFAKNQAAALNIIRKKAAGTEDIYFALASFKQGFHKNAKGKSVLRVRDNVNELKALWFDIDFKGGLSDPTQVVAALREFSNSTGVPAPSILVHSGNGIHAYWPFTTAVPYDRWQRMADRFKELASEHGLPADLVCTADACRVLRPPGTRNYKDANDPKPVYFLYTGGRLNDPDELEKSMGSDLSAEGQNGLGVLPEHLVGRLAGGLQKESSDAEFTGGHASTGEPVESYFSTISTSCGVAAHWLSTRGQDCSEPEWTAALQLLKHASDGQLFLHEISDGHIDYTPQATNEKFEQRLENEAGPTLCKTLAGYRPEICAACPHNGKIKTPLVLGVESATVGQAGANLTSWRVNPDGKGMDRKMRDKDTGQYMWVTQLKRVYEDISTTMSVVSKFFELHFTVKLPGAEDIAIILPTGFLGNDHKLRELMANFGAPLRGSEVNPFKDFMTTWLEKLQRERDVAAVTEQLGWLREGEVITGFSAGTTSYMSDGTQKMGVRIAKEFLAIGRMYEIKGQREPWDKVVAFLTKQNYPAFTVILASAYAAPLLTFTGVQGGILSIVSSESGVGKTSALMTAQSVWGSPTGGMNSLEDTRLSVARKLGFLNNLPAYWDELRGQKVMEDFCTLAFQVSQGKEKTRLDSTATMRDVNTWETMLIAASNESIFDYMGQISAGSDAGVARTFEITVAHPNTDQSHAELAMMFEGLKLNYGHAGQIYAKHLAENHAYIKERMEQTFIAITAKMNMRPQERFWFGMITGLIVGAETSNKAGLGNIDVPTLGKFLLQNVVRLRTRSTASLLATTPSELITAYMMQHQDKGLVVDKLVGGRGMARDYEPQIISVPKSDRLVYQQANDDGIVRVSKGDFTTWLKRSKSISWSAVAKKFRDELDTKEIKTSLGFGTKWATPRQACLDIKIDTMI